MKLSLPMSFKLWLKLPSRSPFWQLTMGMASGQISSTRPLQYVTKTVFYSSAYIYPLKNFHPPVAWQETGVIYAPFENCPTEHYMYLNSLKNCLNPLTELCLAPNSLGISPSSRNSLSRIKNKNQFSFPLLWYTNQHISEITYERIQLFYTMYF